MDLDVIFKTAMFVGCPLPYLLDATPDLFPVFRNEKDSSTVGFQIIFNC